MKTNPYKKIFFLFIIFSALCLMLIATFNYFIDPGYQFSHGKSLETKMVNAFLNNQKVIVRANYNERMLQKIMIKKMRRPPDIFVLGSSHIMPLTHNVFHNRHFFNAGVSSASLEDDIALYYLLQKRGFQPKLIIICLDPWIVSKSSPEDMWKTEYAADYVAGKHMIMGVQHSFLPYDQASGFLKKYSQLLTSAYLNAALKKVIASISDKKNDQMDSTVRIFKYNTVVCQSCFVRSADGARLPTPTEEARKPADADAYVKNNINSWQNFWVRSQLSAQKTVLFESFVRYLAGKNIKVIFYFPPLEPLEYTQLVQKNKNYKMVLIAQKYFSILAEKYHIKIIGSYDPYQVHLTTHYFIDSWHLKEEGIQKLFYDENINLVVSHNKNIFSKDRSKK